MLEKGKRHWDVGLNSTGTHVSKPKLNENKTRRIKHQIIIIKKGGGRGGRQGQLISASMSNRGVSPLLSSRRQRNCWPVSAMGSLRLASVPCGLTDPVRHTTEQKLGQCFIDLVLHTLSFPDHSVKA